MELFSAKTGALEDKAQSLIRTVDGGPKVVCTAGFKDGQRRNEMVSSPTEDTITSSSSLSSISSLSTASTLSSYIDQVLPALPPTMDSNDNNAHCTPNASLNCSTQNIASSSSSTTNNPALLLVEPVTLEPFSHQVGGHSSVLRFDATTVCKPLIQREKKFYESKLPPELKSFIPQFRGILEVKIVDEQDGFLSLEGHKIFGTAEVLEYHRTQSLNNSQVSGSTGAIISTAKSANRSKSSAALQNGENCEKPFRYRFRRTGSIEMPSARSNDDKSVKSSASKESKPSPKDAKGSTTRESRSSSSKNPQAVSSSMVINPWNVKMVKAELEKMRRKDANNKYKFLLQENAVHSFRCPTIIDLKMGTRQYGDDASEEKKKRFIAKSEMSTTAKLGVRLCGLQVYHVPTKKYIYVNKYKGRQCSVDGFKRILFMFLYNGSCLRLDVVDVVLTKLRDLHETVSKLKSYRFFSSSLLIGYDAAVSPPLSPSLALDATTDPETGCCVALNQKYAIQPEPKEQLQMQQQQSLQQQQQRQALATSSMVNKNVSPLNASPSSNSNAPSVTSSSSSSSLSSSLSSTAQLPPTSSHRLTASNSPHLPPLSVATENLSSPLVDMKMIDFAHTTTSGFADEIVYEGPDDGYLFGLESMIEIFEEIKRMTATEHQRMISALNADSQLLLHAGVKT